MKITTNKLTGQYKKFIQPIHSLEFFITNFNAFQINIKKITKIFFYIKTGNNELPFAGLFI